MNPGRGSPDRKGYGRDDGGGRGQSHATASVPRAATPPMYAHKEEVHESPSRMVPPEYSCGSNHVRSGARSYHEGLEIEEHDHALVIAPVTRAMTRN